MKFSVTTNKQSGMYSFEYVIDHFTDKYLKDYGLHGDDWLEAIGAYLDTTKFPCDKINLDMFNPSNNRFILTYHFENNRIGHSAIAVKDNGIMSVSYTSFESDSFDIFSHFITDYFKSYNKKIWDGMLKTANVTNTNDNEVIVIDHTDYKPNGKTETLKGTLEEVFDRYTTHNDRLRYCNGMYWRFADDKVSRLYRMFIDMYNGNYFLDNAVKRGVTID